MKATRIQTKTLDTQAAGRHILNFTIDRNDFDSVDPELERIARDEIDRELYEDLNGRTELHPWSFYAAIEESIRRIGR